MKSRKLLSLLLAALMTAAMIPAAVAADEDADSSAASSVTATEQDSEKAEEPQRKPVDQKKDNEESPAPAPSESAPAENKDEAPAAEGEQAPAEGEQAPAEGEQAPAEGEQAPADNQVTVPVVEKKDAALSASSVLVNGTKTAFDAYTIDGYTYFKLRDVAAALTGTTSSFDVQWNQEQKCIEMTTGKDYAKAEGDLVTGKGEASVTADSATVGMILNGTPVDMAGYTIAGNTYFQLRDLGEKLGFNVDWNAEEKSIMITSKAADDAAKAEGEDAAKTEGEDAAKTEGDDAAKTEGDDAAKTEGDDAAKTEGDDAAKTEGDDAAKTEGEAPKAE